MHGIRQRLLDAFGRVDTVAAGASLQFVEQVLRGIQADVAGQQQGFELFEQLVVDLAARENGLKPAAQLRAGARQSGHETLAPGRCRRLSGDGCIRRGISRFLQKAKHENSLVRECVMNR